MAFVTVPNMEVGKKIAGGLGMNNLIHIKAHAFFIEIAKHSLQSSLIAKS